MNAVPETSVSLPARAPTMGTVQKMSYTHDDMIDYLISHPACSQGELAARYGYSQGWISNVMASDAWQSRLAARREQLVDPTLRMSVEERMRGVTLKSIEVVMAKLSAPVVSDTVALKAMELGAKSIGLGVEKAPQTPAADHLAQLANRLIDLQAGIRKGITYENGQEPVAG